MARRPADDPTSPARQAAPAALELCGALVRHPGGADVGPVTFEVPRGSSVALIGPSGAGKSTLLRCLLGLLVPDTGEARLGGERLGPAAHVLRRRIGYVVQGGGLFPHLTARENVALVARYLGWPPARIDRRIGELATLARLDEGALGRYPGQLSGGQAQRVGLMRALALDPEVLLLDEPLGALDPLTRADLQADLRGAFQALGKTVVLVTHDLAEAAFFAGRLLLMRDGKVVQDGSLEELLRAPAEPFVTHFLHAHRSLALPEHA
ncbi:MAG TPA: ATP-binding cassette domain-containing protein [Anaeromyxobacteraceae bacterium]|nr:ATP-binding cassette domain-containing protein [Anaeromyxobacteraceae bacterium]